MNASFNILINMPLMVLIHKLQPFATKYDQLYILKIVIFHTLLPLNENFIYSYRMRQKYLIF